MRLTSFDGYMLSVIAGLVVILTLIVASGDSIGVEVTLVSPEDGAVVSSVPDVRITFDQPMDRDTVEEGFQIEPDIPGTFRWRINTLIFSPDIPYDVSTTYVVTLDDSVRSVTGRQLNEDFELTFSTASTQAMQIYYLAPANDATRSLWRVNNDGTEVVEIFAPEEGVFQFDVHPDGSQIAAAVFADSRRSADLWLIESNGSNPVQLTDCSPGVCGQPVWSPEGDIIAYARQLPSDSGILAPQRIWLWDVATGNTNEVFQDSQVLGYNPVWSPDGNLLSFYDSNPQAIRILDWRTAAITVVETPRADTWSFHPEDNTLAFTDLRTEEGWFVPQLFLVNIEEITTSEESGKRSLLEDPQEDQTAIWSPDGEWLAFRRRFTNFEEFGTGSQIMLYQPATGELRQVTTDTSFTNSNIAWSPDSTQITFQRYELRTADFVPEVLLYDLDSETLTILATDAVDAAWQGGS